MSEDISNEILAVLEKVGNDDTVKMTRELIRRRKADALRPMSEAPTTGPIVEVLAATKDRAGCNGWLIVHYAEGGGEEQPPFKGWFFWTGYGFQEIAASSLLGWIPLPEPKV